MTRASPEVVIVGGGPAGIATALFLAHARPELTDRVVVLEAGRYPREKPCAGGLGARGDRALARIGVTVDVPSVPVQGVALRAQGQTLTVRQGLIGRVVRRLEFDAELAAVARARGVRVIDGCAVSALRRTSAGVELDTARGPFTARVVVGADGVRSVVRRWLGFGPGRWRAQAVEVDTEPVDGDLDRDLLLFDLSRHGLAGYTWEFPTLVGGRALVSRGVYALREPGAPPGPELRDVLEDELTRRGLRLRDHHQRRYAERGFEPHAPAARERVLLVGEAAGIDPVTGEGIAQALQYGATAGAYLARKLEERSFAFEDWGRAVRAASIGRDLHVRSRFPGVIYGPPRAHIERFLLQSPELLRVGLQHFAGQPWGRADLLRAGWGALRWTAAWALVPSSRSG